jgi:hypothetical protein
MACGGKVRVNRAAISSVMAGRDASFGGLFQ